MTRPRSSTTEWRSTSAEGVLSSSAESTSKQLLEKITGISSPSSAERRAKVLESTKAASTTTRKHVGVEALLCRRRTVLVISSTLFLVGKNVVGRLNVVELFLCIRLFTSVGVPFLC